MIRVMTDVDTVGRGSRGKDWIVASVRAVVYKMGDESKCVESV